MGDPFASGFGPLENAPALPENRPGFLPIKPRGLENVPHQIRLPVC